MTSEHSKSVKQHVEVVVFGCIAGTGTAVLVDKTQYVWLFNAPYAVDRYLHGVAKRAMLIMRSDDVMAKSTEIVFIDYYDNVSIEFEKEVSDDEGMPDE